MKFKVLLRKGAGRGRAREAESSFWRSDLSMVHAFYVYLFVLHEHDTRWWELVELSADRSKRLGSGGHGWACRSASRPGL